MLISSYGYIRYSLHFHCISEDEFLFGENESKHSVFIIEHKVLPNLEPEEKINTSLLRRNGRTIMSQYQKHLLNQAYAYNKFPSKSEKLTLSQTSGLPFSVVSNWYHNKRRKDEVGESPGLRNGRTSMTGYQRQQLENSYQTNKFPSKEDKMFLSQTCDLPYMVVFNWFQNRRRRDSLPNY